MYCHYLLAAIVTWSTAPSILALQPAAHPTSDDRATERRIMQLCPQENSTATVAMAQVFCLDGDRAGNFVRIENAIAEASQADADIVCFPETCILGWTNADAHDRAHPIPGRDTEVLCELARKHGVLLCVGLAEKEGDDLYDSVVLIDEQGEILLKHRKINVLSELMDPPYTRGSEVRTVETRFGNIGLLICADTFDEPTVEKMKSAAPDLLLVPYGWANREEAWPQHAESLHSTVTNAAKQIGCPVVGTNAVGKISKGPWAGMTYGGQSIAVDSKGELLAKAADRDKDVKLVQIRISD